MIRLLTCLALVLWPLAPATAADRDGVAFRIADPRITESSGLVDTDDAMFTVNDSGHDALLFRMDPGTGRTTRTIRFADRVVDVEALAPGRRPGVVWVGDIGDNRRERSHIDVYRVDVGSGAVEHRELRYPEGPRDAEALLVTRDARVLVVTKGLSGEVYSAAPGDDTMRRIARVGPVVTDGALLPDQRHVLLRDYANLHLYTFPAFDHVASMRLPRQPQGEGLSVSPSGRVRISSEGTNQPVRDVRLSAQMRAALAPPSPTPTTTPSPTSTLDSQPAPSQQEDTADEAWPPWVWAGLLLVPLALLLAGGFAWARRSRRDAAY